MRVNSRSEDFELLGFLLLERQACVAGVRCCWRAIRGHMTCSPLRGTMLEQDIDVT